MSWAFVLQLPRVLIVCFLCDDRPLLYLRLSLFFPPLYCAFFLTLPLFFLFLPLLYAAFSLLPPFSHQAQTSPPYIIYSIILFSDEAHVLRGEENHLVDYILLFGKPGHILV